MDALRPHRRRIEAMLLPIAFGTALVWLWERSVAGSGTTVFPSPAQVLDGVTALAQAGHLFGYVRDSLFRVAIGFSIAALLGVPIGLALGRHPRLSIVVDPVLQLMRPISPIAWIPVAIVLFGVGDPAAFFLVFLGCFFPIVVSTATAVRTVPAIFLASGRNFGLSAPALFARVVLPGALPQILTGLRIALGIGWLVLVAAEMVAVDSGLGYLVLDARNAGKRYDLVVAGMLMIGLIGLCLDILLRSLQHLKQVSWGVRAT